ncbi:MAG: PUR family DNA/RNA-binding protein [Candidatus Margulisbacteria bacterium]|jgi:hypothetical protein|nr:PUR family DNA/RNA-binding protein [Candidatus Margulisiibacteriota bacterium]
METTEKAEKNGGKELFTKTVKAGKRTYFIGVKEASNKNKYVTLTESKLVEDNKFDRFTIMVFQDKLADFAGAFAEACKVVG